MSYIVSEVYEALREAGASEQSAKAAAGAIPVGQYFASKEDLQKAFGNVETEIAGLRGELKADIAGVEVKIAEVKTDLANEFKTLYRHVWVVGASIVALIFTPSKLFSG